MDLAFLARMCFPLKRRDSFLFLNNNFKNGLKSPLIFVLFLNGKQNKKEKP